MRQSRTSVNASSIQVDADGPSVAHTEPTTPSSECFIRRWAFWFFVLGLVATVWLLRFTKPHPLVAGLPALGGLLVWLVLSSAHEVFRRNLFLIVLFGTLASAWVLRYTDWFPAIGGLLALGGLFSWLAFVSKLLKGSRLDQLQDWSDRSIFGNRWATGWCFLLIELAYVSVCRFGTVQIEAVEETTERVVYMEPIGSAPDLEGRRVSAAAAIRELFPAPWGSPGKVRVRVKGYPDTVIAVQPLALTRLYVPASFLRPVVLLRPTPELIDARKGLTIKVSLNGRDYGPVEFTGNAIWLGCDENVEIPALQESLWRAELTQRRREPLLRFWLQPKEFPGLPNPKAGDQINVTLWDHDQPYGAPRTFSVKDLRRVQEFPQVEILDAPQAEVGNDKP